MMSHKQIFAVVTNSSVQLPWPSVGPSSKEQLAGAAGATKAPVAVQTAAETAVAQTPSTSSRDNLPNMGGAAAATAASTQVGLCFLCWKEQTSTVA